ncbi:MAG: acetyl-CoA carboxylase biotin carboxylase subunit [Deltaproteobacteria bacterium]|nr:acetyl-CoA carboxylase biotin carboxylase subunit [Deltaproteobacteria bacterium]
MATSPSKKINPSTRSSSLRVDGERIRTIKKILIANRGEIAVRIMRTCRDLGIETVAIYSEADRAALHVQVADEAHCIGPAPSVESYLIPEKIIDAAKKSGADAIHPGYGFLSEKSAFSKACADAGIIFLGPKPETIEAMGSKIGARKIAEAAKVPMVPGTKEPLKDAAEAKGIAKKIGYPVFLKAVSGGGGKGMRLVEKEADMEASLTRAASEAKKSFNDDRLYIEKAILNPRHVEVQIAFDQQGNGLHLFERECSLQRRHQKVIEEAPSPFISANTRKKMTEAAVRLAASVGYTGVGTLEFLVDKDENFYFLEMNTRLQVEHPVTELITGLDLVKLQIEIAEGKPFSLKQSDIIMRGHAVECRLYAEDPENNFFPSPGRIEWMTIPEGPGVRNDSGVYEGAMIPIYYDPLIAKLITWGENRRHAFQRMQRALREYEIGGFKNNIPFLRTLVENPDVLSGKMYTHFIDDHPELLKRRPVDLPKEIIFGVAAYDRTKRPVAAPVSGVATVGRETMSQWKAQGLRDTLGQRF